MSGYNKIRNWCASIGLEPIAIKGEDIDTVIEYLNDIGVDLMTTNPIPLGYDYGCVDGKDKCEKKYYSFNGKLKSYDISNDLI
jgi:hypothetical protein